MHHHVSLGLVRLAARGAHEPAGAAVHHLAVFRQRLLGEERLAARGAHVVPDARVPLHVHAHLGGGEVRLAAHRTPVVPLLAVHEQHVLLGRGAAPEPLAALLARVRPLVGVRPPVRPERAARREPLAALRARVVLDAARARGGGGGGGAGAGASGGADGAPVVAMRSVAVDPRGGVEFAPADVRARPVPLGRGLFVLGPAATTVLVRRRPRRLGGLPGARVPRRHVTAVPPGSVVVGRGLRRLRPCARRVRVIARQLLLRHSRAPPTRRRSAVRPLRTVRAAPADQRRQRVRVIGRHAPVVDPVRRRRRLLLVRQRVQKNGKVRGRRRAIPPTAAVSARAAKQTGSRQSVSRTFCIDAVRTITGKRTRATFGRMFRNTKKRIQTCNV